MVCIKVYKDALIGKGGDSQTCIVLMFPLFTMLILRDIVEAILPSSLKNKLFDEKFSCLLSWSKKTRGVGC